MAPTADETTPLFGSAPAPAAGAALGKPPAASDPTAPPADDPRLPLFRFLEVEAKTPAGLLYESFTIFLILLSVATFVLASVFLPEYNDSPLAHKCDSFCDALWFGNYPDNALSSLGIGATSVVEIFVVAVFTVDYLLRFYTADLLDPKFGGFMGRLRFIPTFFSLVDLASTVPFYVDAFLLPDTDLAASTFLRMFRLLRMMKVEGRFDLALGLIDDVLVAQRQVLGTALFVGVTVWGVLSSFFYVAERTNPDMIYCGQAPGCGDDVDTGLCTTDEWGFVDCAAAGCEGDGDGEACWNLYRSIVDSGFWTLSNLFGEFPLVDQHSPWGQVLGTFTAVFAVAVFALPVGVIASGFEDQIARSREGREAEGPAEEKGEEGDEDTFVADESTLRGVLYNSLHNEDTPIARHVEYFLDILIVGCAVAFMFDTIADEKWHSILRWFQFLCFLAFAADYALRMYSAGANPRYRGPLLAVYASTFLNLVDAAAVFPYLVGLVAFPGSGLPGAFLLFKIFHFEKFSRAFTTFDDVLRENMGVLAVTGFSAVLLWIFFSSLLYYLERNSLDEEMAVYHKTIPDAMWITLLNLSGECPLAHYSPIGKVVVGIIGLFATAVFGVPIGLLGAGFEEIVTSENKDSPDEGVEADPTIEGSGGSGGFQNACYQFVNGHGSKVAHVFWLFIYFLIGATVAIGVVQTVPGYQDVLSGVEYAAVIIFTIEYAMRFIGAGADPEFATGSNGFMARVKFIVSFYSIIDLMAIVPFYLSLYIPNGWIDQHDEYFRMMRLFRLLRLDKYIPSISLIDDVLRLKKKVLIVACYAAITLCILFTAAMYVVERNDDEMEIDPLPLYGCVENCHMADRYSNYFTSLSLTGIHLTGDFPLIEYGGLGRIVLFFIVIAAVGVESIPSGVIASGFAEIVQTKNKSKTEGDNKAGDDWYDTHYRLLEGQPPPPSKFGPRVDAWMVSAKEYLDGSKDETTGKVSRTKFSYAGRRLFFILIVANVLAVILESVPEIDRYVGNTEGNFFDVFEAWSVLFFTIDYILRLFSAKKSREALYSPWVYAITFFGIVDLISILPWYIQVVLALSGHPVSGDEAKIFRIFRIFRILQLEDFLVAFSKLDNVFRASKDVLKATGLMAIIIWVGTSALFFIFEANNPNFRECDESVPLLGTADQPGCYDSKSTAECNEFYPGMCSQAIFTHMPNTMYYVAVFLGGEWGVVDFTWQGKLVCMFLCIAGIALYSIPVGTLFDSFGAIVGLSDEDEEEEE